MENSNLDGSNLITGIGAKFTWSLHLIKKTLFY